MNRSTLALLCDPVTRAPLSLHDEVVESDGWIVAGTLRSASGATYPIVNGIPRFVAQQALLADVQSFGDQWNHFNFTAFREHWTQHMVRHTFGSLEAFAGRVIVDAGGGSGAQTRWMLDAGAAHVFLLDLSDSIDDVVQRNLRDVDRSRVDVLHCSIDQPPLRPASIAGLVICHNVIQHTPSVERTARALWSLVAPGGEFVFNCYPTNDGDPVRWVRFHLVYRPLRAVLKRQSFRVRLAYAQTMGRLRLVPGVGTFLEKAGFCVTGDVPVPAGTPAAVYRERVSAATALNTFDGFGAHEHQHHKSEAELRALVTELQPDASCVSNLERYFERPPPIGIALRLRRS
ncbi:MAG TPA: methyltransferase domain-containing protein [Gemmatimonadaceae bacterium]|nr:methyltransferase domain-containing protein [Gemmatimonadaceae bacterium]